MKPEKNYTILYVDDEESNLRIFKNTFRKSYKILTALSGTEGLKLLQDNKVDLILSDQRMPGMSGVEFLKTAMGKYPELNRILITAYTDYDILRDAVNELNIFQYIEKPWREEDIKTTIDSALEIHQLKLENMKLTTSLIKNNEELKRINEELNEEIEKHKETQLELIKQKEHAEKSNLLKSAFLANMSHEVRTPMNSIMGFAGLLKDEVLSLEKREEFLGIVNNSCIQLLHIIESIVEISKIDSNNVELYSSLINVNDLLEKVYLAFKPKCPVELQLSKKLPEECNNIQNDAIKLEQILINLLNNAIKFTSEGKIDFGVETTESMARFFVKDTGIGIEKDNFKMIFERFSQVENSYTKRYGGNGLGLAISKAYVEKMGGKIWVISEPGKGSTFYFSLPLG
ncbi:MAG: response regulator [Prolixibacteraceae bacterium]|nr:response regulator [Prolixibacteraceae bacterium]